MSETQTIAKPSTLDSLRNDSQPMLSVRGLRTEFQTSAGVAAAVDDVSYDVAKGETLAIVGESGSGKSVTALSIMGLIPSPPGRITAGQVLYRGQDLLQLDEKSMEIVRGRELAMIFQEPMTSLNPVHSIGRQMTEGIRHHLGLGSEEAWERALDMLRRVHIPAPESRMKEYPHQLSGGMLQRVMISMALSCNPKVLLADEPTTALDVTIQAQILAILQELQQELGTAIVLITHDMGVVAEAADRVIIMYAGRKVEEGSVEKVFSSPRHPYTCGLLGALPKLGQAGPVGSKALKEIPGIVPALTDLPVGCRFAARCVYAVDHCHKEYPPFEEKSSRHWSSCWESERLDEVNHDR